MTNNDPLATLSTFTGFAPPTENWSKLPHEFINALPLVETIGEMKVILYILRHTWGFQDTEKRITLDEFENGRKRRDGSRLDNGTGLSKPTICDGLKRAVAHGFITVEVDDSDAGRVKKTYALAMKGLETDPQREKVLTPGVKEFDPRGKKTSPRSEKETHSKIPIEKESVIPITHGARAPSLPGIPLETLEPATLPGNDNERSPPVKRKQKRRIDAGRLPSKKQTEHREMVRALAPAFQVDLSVATMAQRGRMNRLSKELRGAGYTLAWVRKARLLWEEDWRGLKGDAPTDTQFKEKLYSARRIAERRRV